MNKIIEHGCVNWIGSFAKAVTKLKLKYDKKQAFSQNSQSKKIRPAPAHRYEKSSGQNWATNRYVPRLCDHSIHRAHRSAHGHRMRAS